jgi:hypothetical protein
MAELKTRVNDASVDAFLDAIPNDEVRKDCRAIADLMRKVAGAEPRMWGASIVGFGSYHYKYASGREGDWMLTAFSPRKNNITLYVMPGFEGYDELMKKLGTYSCGKSCIYIKRLSDLHRPTLKKLVTASVKHLKRISAPAGKKS